MNEPARSQELGLGKRVLPVLASLAVVAGLIFAISMMPGCGKPPPPPPPPPEGAKGKPWQAAGQKLRKDADAPSCRAVTATLNNELAVTSDVPKPSALSSEAEAALTALVPLSEDDRVEIRTAAFSSHDGVYLADCLYFRDAVRSLDVPELSGETPDHYAEHRADLGFAWVCRQVYLNPWLIPTGSGLMGTALPPTYVLRRGYGSGLERMYVFLALLQQMGLDGCLIGQPDAANKPAGFVATGSDKKTVLTGTPRGPFWAVGVRVGADVKLYDPWRGQAFPVTLNKLKADPDAQKAWFEDKANVSGLTAEEAKNATVYLAVPVNSLSPRIATLEEQLKPENLGVRLAINPAALRGAFPDPKPAFWNTPGDPFAYGRTARMFLPLEDGGADRTERGAGRLIDLYMRAQIPPEVFAPPPQLRDSPDASDRMRNAIAGIYFAAFFTPPNARERIQRGQFQTAARELVSKQDEFAHGRERIRNNRDAEQQIREWVEETAKLEDARGLALLKKDTEGVAAAQADLDVQWRKNAVQLLVDRAVSEVGWAEATLLLALYKHEQAEQAQARLERATGPDVPALKQAAAEEWAVALAEWRSYASRADVQAAFAGRPAHVKALAARAEKLANQK